MHRLNHRGLSGRCLQHRSANRHMRYNPKESGSWKVGMKQRIMWQKNDGSTVLKIKLGKNDVLNYVAAMRASATRIENLLPLSFNEKDILPDLHYNISEVVPLVGLNERKLTPGQLKSLLKEIIFLFEALQSAGMPVKNLLLEPDMVYLCLEECSLRFVYLPIEGIVEDDRSALGLLTYLVHNTEYGCDEEKQYAESLLDFIRHQTAFSVFEIKEFLGLTNSVTGAQSGDAALSVHERDTACLRNGGPKQPSGLNVITEVSYADSGSLATQPLQKAHHSLHADAFYGPHKQYSLVREQDGAIWPLNSPSISIGRSKSAQLRVSESITVSRQHAILHVDANFVEIQDQGSSNGTYINGLRLTPNQKVRIVPSDVITLGDQVFLISQTISQ